MQGRELGIIIALVIGVLWFIVILSMLGYEGMPP